MSPGNIVILAIVILALFMFAVGSTEYSLPFFQRIKFDNVCNKYLYIIQSEGGLSETDRNDLVEELNKIGFESISITAPRKVTWNTEAILKVEADYTFKTIKGNMNKEDKTIRAVYENKTRVMTLER